MFYASKNNIQHITLTRLKKLTHLITIYIPLTRSHNTFKVCACNENSRKILTRIDI